MRLPFFLLAATAAHAATIWIEGEAPAKSTMKKHGWYDGVKKDALSGGGWLSHYGERAGEASYEFEVAEQGSYEELVAKKGVFAELVRSAEAG